MVNEQASTGKNFRVPKKTRHLPGEEGVWVFILGDMMVFSLFFLVFTYYRGQAPELFANSQATLNFNYAAINTLLLLTSSWFVALGLHAVRCNKPLLASRLLVLAGGCGLGFAGVKLLEYGEKIRAGYILTTNDFYMYYYIFTGIHFLHLIIGMVVLIFLWSKCKKLRLAGKTTASDIQTFESGAAYWHMVDLLWIVLFPLIYLVK
tara:strand:- start:194 stop:811 length:618 start_codon:yes stop_codon:yes gene_type:complete